MKRRDFLAVVAGIAGSGAAALAGGFGRLDPLRPGGRFRRFVIPQATTVHEATLARFRTSLLGLRFVRVGVLRGDLQYLVNRRLPLLPARYCWVRPGDVVEWREV